MARRYRRGELRGDGPEQPRPGKGSGTGSGPRHHRTATLADTFRGVRTRKSSLWDESWRVDVHAEPPTRRKQLPDRLWYPRNIGEMLLGLGWSGIEERTIWITAPELASKAPMPSWRDLFAVEFPMAQARTSDKFEFDLARFFPGRLEMPTCRKAHRVAAIDLARQNRLEGGEHRRGEPIEFVAERFCECYRDDEGRPHEGRLWLYRWR